MSSSSHHSRSRAACSAGARPRSASSRSTDAASPAALSLTLARQRDQALLFRRLATLRTDIPLFESVDELRWTGPTSEFRALAARLDAAASGPLSRLV